MTESARGTSGRCGEPLGQSSVAGLCAACLLQDGLGWEQEDSSPARTKADPVVSGVHSQSSILDSEMNRQFGDYNLIEEIGRGGMGVVYKARQKSLDRLVAIKMLHLGPHANPGFIKRFRAEAVAAAGLQHPHIVAIHEVGVQGGQHFFAMDYVEGPSLARLVGSQPLPGRQAARYLKAIAEAIQFAHERGILHRDLKPSNVLIDTNDQPQVMDFGLAKRLDTFREVARFPSRAMLFWFGGFSPDSTLLYAIAWDGTGTTHFWRAPPLSEIDNESAGRANLSPSKL